MSLVKIQGNASGTGEFTIAAPNSNTNRTLTLPDNTGTILTGSSAITASQLPVGSVLQVVSANKANVFSTSSSSFTDITDLSASITPSSSTNKILVICNIPIAGQDTSSGIGFNLVRGATSIGQGTGGTTTNAIAVVYMNANNLYTGTSFNYLDSPATTSSTTYKVQMLSSGATTAYINRRVSDTYFGSSCTLTLMEIAA
jgi:hypothetical protein